jgi:hypothetical protein
MASLYRHKLQVNKNNFSTKVRLSSFLSVTDTPAVCRLNSVVFGATKKKKTEDQHLEKAFELLTACSNQAINDECQHFGNMITAKLRHYNDTVQCAIPNEVMGIFLKWEPHGVTVNLKLSRVAM